MALFFKMLPEAVTKINFPYLEKRLFLKILEESEEKQCSIFLLNVCTSSTTLTLIRLGFLRVVFSGVGQFDPSPFIFKQVLI